ncbi:PH domain-containing protein [Dermatophilaceae bacterium Soc4.6]
MSKTPHDNPDQLARIQLVLLPGELILAVYDGSGGSTGMVGLTDRRVIVQDNTFVGGKSGITSLPYSRIQSVSFILDRATALRAASSSVVSIQVPGQAFEIQFRGEEQARHTHDVVLTHLVHG